MRQRGPLLRWRLLSRVRCHALAIACFAAALCGTAPRALAQEEPGQRQEEVVANLAAGRVVIVVLKDAILIGTAENPVEAQTRVPAPVQLAGLRVGVLLGAVDWFSPSSHQEVARLDKELPHLRVATLFSNTPHLQQEQSGQEAVDIQSIGQGLFDRLREPAARLHTEIHWPENEPFVELLIAGFLPNYGPEVWQVTYGLRQLPAHGDFWDTRVQRPRYLQIWPPDKGQPHALMEFRYPAGEASPSLVDLLRQKDPRLEKICAADPQMKEVAEHLLAGETPKIPAADAVPFFRAALEAITPPNARATVSIMRAEKGFEWILAPPPEPKKPEEEKQREPGAPTLVKPPS